MHWLSLHSCQTLLSFYSKLSFSVTPRSTEKRLAQNFGSKSSISSKLLWEKHRIVTLSYCPFWTVHLQGFLLNDFTVQDQLSHCTNMYVEEILQQQFGALIAFVKQAEGAQIAAKIPADRPIPHFGCKEAGPIAKDFTAKWSAAIETLNRSAPLSFLLLKCPILDQAWERLFIISYWDCPCGTDSVCVSSQFACSPGTSPCGSIRLKGLLTIYFPLYMYDWTWPLAEKSAQRGRKRFLSSEFVSRSRHWEQTTGKLHIEESFVMQQSWLAFLEIGLKVLKKPTASSSLSLPHKPGCITGWDSALRSVLGCLKKKQWKMKSDKERLRSFLLLYKAVLSLTGELVL